ncbi:hypothetical protein Ciccas_003339 [Cichlidogyrus casuarinus]|uniref:CRAL-TRIO domain-containing protein n=1 Tax=Cichlidogyrus casuarinus TaxID=1844966 RepID=A0ABD2QEM9_9PLAT
MLEYVYDDEEKLIKLRPELEKAIRECDIELEDEPDFSVSTDTLTRFLRARNYDVKEACKQLKATVEWRKSFRPLKAKCTWCEQTPGYHSMRQIGHDKLGRPIVYSSFSQAQTNKNSVEDSIAHTTYLIENAKKTMQGDATMWVFVIDCTGMTLPCCNPKLGFGVAQACGSFYPERLGKILVINHSMMFHHVWQAIKVFIDPKTVTKLKLIKNKEKMDKHFSTLFDEETAEWLKEEIRLNEKEAKNDDSIEQQYFWKARADHDPRGTKTYVDKFIKPLESVKEEEEIESQVSRHRPHPNILGHLMGKEYALKRKQKLKEEDVKVEDLKEYEIKLEEEEKTKDTGSNTIKNLFNKLKM